MSRREILERLKRAIQEQLVKEFALSRLFATQVLTDKRKILISRIETLIKKHSRFERINDLKPVEEEELVKEIVDELLGYGPIDDLMKDEEITEILINGPDKVYAEKEGKKILTDIEFSSVDQLNHLIQKMVSYGNRKVDESTPYVDVSLGDGTRVNVILPPLALNGPVVTIRKLSKSFVRIEDLVKAGTLSKQAAEFLVACVLARINIIFSGPTGVGKTTTLGILSFYISRDERIVVMEDTRELTFYQEHVVRLQARFPNIEGKGEITIRDLLKNSLRMRPDRIVIGEVRGGEALDMVQAMASGHSGALGVVHAASPEDVISRLEAMIATSGVAIPLWAIRRHIANNLNLIVQQERMQDGSRKVTKITEVHQGSKADEIELDDIYVFNQRGFAEDGKILGEMAATGAVPSFIPKLRKKGINIDSDFFKKQ
ncbi:MAG: Flp pilus assembly complex ATPase component TadA [Candidatus Omnitrophica bacterium]|nr:Flp pilus assembly complex ATPase component TadA [Candidatus Omnitrophota bacterium]